MTFKEHRALADIKNHHVSKAQLMNIMKTLNILNNAGGSLHIKPGVDGLMMGSYAYRAMEQIAKIIDSIKD